MSERRAHFLRGFLAMFGNPTVTITKETSDTVEAHVSWPDDDEPQDIRWHVTNTWLPDPKCLEIAAYIASRDLLDIRRLTAPRQKLYDELVKERGLDWSYEAFQGVFEELLSIKIPTMYKGHETDDAFFIDECKPPTPEEKEVLQQIRRRNLITLVVFLLFLPACILYSRFSLSTTVAFALCYIVLTGVCSLFTTLVTCPRAAGTTSTCETR